MLHDSSSAWRSPSWLKLRNLSFFERLNYEYDVISEFATESKAHFPPLADLVRSKISNPRKSGPERSLAKFFDSNAFSLALKNRK